MSVVELESVSIRYERAVDGQPVEIVADYDLALDAGHMHCLAGRSGSGKTSILRVAAGLVRPTGGDVLWEGEPLGGLRDDAVTRAVGLRRLPRPGRRAARRAHRARERAAAAVPDRRATELAARARELLERLEVGNRAAHRPEQLSVGERQRVALARALLLEPQVLMVDEPTASLDRVTADGVIAVLSQLRDEGIAVLVAAHDEHLVAVADSRTDLT